MTQIRRVTLKQNIVGLETFAKQIDSTNNLTRPCIFHKSKLYVAFEPFFSIKLSSLWPHRLMLYN